MQNNLSINLGKRNTNNIAYGDAQDTSDIKLSNPTFRRSCSKIKNRKT